MGYAAAAVPAIAAPIAHAGYAAAPAYHGYAAGYGYPGPLNLDLLLLLLSPTVECTLMPSLLSTELVMDTLPTLVLWLIPTELWSLWTSLLYRQLELITSPSLDPPSTREREKE